MHIVRDGPISKVVDAIVDRIDSAAERLADRIRAEQSTMRDRLTPEQGELLPMDANDTRLRLEGPAPPARQITSRRSSTLHVVPDADYLAELEATDGRRLERMENRDRGKPVKPPEPR